MNKRGIEFPRASSVKLKLFFVDQGGQRGGQKTPRILGKSLPKIRGDRWGFEGVIGKTSRDPKTGPLRAMEGGKNGVLL